MLSISMYLFLKYVFKIINRPPPSQNPYMVSIEFRDIR